MRLLIDIGHPAHVHNFKHLALYLLEKNHKVLFTCRNKEVTIDLLEFYRFEFISFGKPYKSILGKIFGLFWFTIRTTIIAAKFKPDLILNSTFYSAFSASLLHIPHIALEDTFNMETVKLYLPFTNCVLSPDFPHVSLGKKEIRYAGYHELLYLHPNWYIPNECIGEFLRGTVGARYFILRFVAWNASHDFGQKGLAYNTKILIIRKLEKFGKVYISSESELPIELQQYKMPIAPSQMHDALACASLFIGEGATMASEAGCLGVPAIYVNSLPAGNCKELGERYGLVYTISDAENLLKKIDEIISINNFEKNYKAKKYRLLADKIDVTSFLIWFVENFPNSMRIMKVNLDYQYKFGLHIKSD